MSKSVICCLFNGWNVCAASIVWMRNNHFFTSIGNISLSKLRKCESLTFCIKLNEVSEMAQSIALMYLNKKLINI